jgi:mRNA-degrading endonuclease RelE of RelBE toxin-antitoxin system
VHTVVETAQFLRDAARAGLSETARAEIVRLIAENPTRGDVIPGTGGARKLRLAGRGKGKSGGYRVVTYYIADDVPVFLLAVIDKGERADLTQMERNELRIELTGVAKDYREAARRRVAALHRRQK